MQVSGSVLLVRNTQPSSAVFTTEGPNGKVHIEWGGSGNADQTDVQEVPEHIASDVNFRRALNRGIFEVVEATPEALAQITDAGSLWRDRQAAAASETTVAIVHEQKNDIVVIPCVGPGAQGKPCSADVMVRDSDRNKRPPLCHAHSGLAGQYIPTGSEERIGEASGGKQTIVWARAVMTGTNQIPD